MQYKPRVPRRATIGGRIAGGARTGWRAGRAGPRRPASFPYPFGDRAVVVGEFGGACDGGDATWQDAFVDRLVDRDAPATFSWCLNPNSGDTGGLLLDAWEPVDDDELAPLRRPMP